MLGGRGRRAAQAAAAAGGGRAARRVSLWGAPQPPPRRLFAALTRPPSQDGDTALSTAARNGNIEEADLLIKHISTISSTEREMLLDKHELLEQERKLKIHFVKNGP